MNNNSEQETYRIAQERHMLLDKHDTPFQWFLAGMVSILTLCSATVVNSINFVQAAAILIMIIIPISIATMTGMTLLKESKTENYRLIRLTPLSEKVLINYYARKLVFRLRFQLAILLSFFPLFWLTFIPAKSLPTSSIIVVALIASLLNLGPIIFGVTFLIKPPENISGERAECVKQVRQLATNNY